MKEIKNLKQFSLSQDRLEGSHLMCPGCAHTIIVRELLNSTDAELVIATNTGCLEVGSAIYPYTSWDTSWIHVGFENAATVISAAEVMYRVLKKKGRIKDDRRVKFVAIGGDGATYDIGFQWLSGAIERGHDFCYICLDNEVYANTGGQRSGATPIGANTTTTPSGSISYGKIEAKKPIVDIIAAHQAPYVAQVAPHKWKIAAKVFQKAIETEGPTFVNVLSPCTTEWKFEPNKTIDISELAVDSLIFPMYEIINGEKLNILYRPKNIIPVKEYLAAQGRFKHLLKKENEHIVKALQEAVNKRWEYLQRREEAGV